MKKILIIFISGFLSVIAIAQVPQGFNYQALAADASANPIRNADLEIRITILSDTILPVIVWQELHSGIRTNAHGVFSLVIGSGARQPASTAAKFSEINWSASQMFLRTQILYQSTWRNMGSAKMWTVPYSMVAGDLSGSVKKLVVSGITSSVDETLFEVKNRAGQTVFAVYNEGVRVYVDDGLAKGSKGGFAIGGFSTAKASSQNLFVVSPDSIRAYIGSNPVKGSKGGFAIGGFDLAKAQGEEFLRVTRDSTRVYVNQAAKGSKGGFAIGGFSDAKGDINNFLNLTPLNYFIGHNSGRSVTTGLYNSSLGYESGLNISSGESNAFLGYQSGYNNTTGSSNLFLGYKTGFSNTKGNYNTFLGYKAGYSNTDGLNNSFLGSFAGENNSTGSYNIFVGDSSGFNNTIGENNSFVGTKAGFSNISGYSNSFIGNYTGHANKSGSENVFIGNFSGYSNIISGGNVIIGNRAGYLSKAGWNNVFIGTETGYNNIDGEGNVYIGYKTGINNVHGTRNIFIGNFAGGDQQGSNKLIIDNFPGDSSQVAIWGDLSAKKLRFNSTVGIGTHPDWHDLSIYNKYSRATLNIKGKGDAYDYSAISLESEQTPNAKSYVISHKANNYLGFLYFDGIGWFPRIWISPSGKISIGTYDDGTEMLDVNGNGRFRAVTSGTYSAPLNITSNGTLTTSTSDISMKKNIVSIDDGLKKVLKMKGVYFSWKNDPLDVRKVGFIAQEMEQVLPEVVFTNTVDGLKGINYSEITAVLVQAVKEQQHEIDLQRKEIDELKALVNSLIVKNNLK
jgi:trimeric autotransporter adhesin